MAAGGRRATCGGAVRSDAVAVLGLGRRGGGGICGRWKKELVTTAAAAGRGETPPHHILRYFLHNGDGRVTHRSSALGGSRTAGEGRV